MNFYTSVGVGLTVLVVWFLVALWLCTLIGRAIDIAERREAERRAAIRRHPSVRPLDDHAADAMTLLDFDRWEKELQK